jgi:hypothetical protein
VEENGNLVFKVFAEIRCADHFASSEGAKHVYFSMKAYLTAVNAGILKYYYAYRADDNDDNNNDDDSDDGDSDDDDSGDDDSDDDDHDDDDDGDDDDYQSANESIEDNQCGNYKMNVEDIRKLNEEVCNFLGKSNP